MSIDGIIEKVVVDHRRRETTIHLADRICPDGGYSIAGQPKLIIRGVDHWPKIGMIVWGGSSRVSIELPGPDHTGCDYKRVGYTRLEAE